MIFIPDFCSKNSQKAYSFKYYQAVHNSQKKFQHTTSFKNKLKEYYCQINVV